MPKFRLESTLELKKVLKNLGISTAFSEMANFTPMSECPVKISDIHHKAVIKASSHCISVSRRTTG